MASYGGMDSYDDYFKKATDKIESNYSIMLSALKEIAKGEGPFSNDRLIHAINTIEAMQAIAIAAIERVEKNG